MDNVWREIDDEILGCLSLNGAMAPDEVARELGMSEGEATAFLCILAREGKLRIRLVEAVGAEIELRHPAAA
jgi:hypothetical protein